MSGELIELEVWPPLGGQKQAPLTVIVPLARGEAEPADLLAVLPRTFELVLARGGTRASSMNRAAAAATGRNLWFVHADTSITPDGIEALLRRLTAGDALHYFDLRFDGGALMRLTELGVGFRSRVLGIPFGDQALCIPAPAFRALGGYDETLDCGEDHVLVRRARRAGLPVRATGASVVTSARKYRQNGWFRTTLRHLLLTMDQARRA